MEKKIVNYLGEVLTESQFNWLVLNRATIFFNAEDEIEIKVNDNWYVGKLEDCINRAMSEPKYVT